MSDNKRKFTRRDFIKSAGAAGLGSMLLPLDSVAQAQSGQSTMVPTRPYGKTGVNVPILGLGGDLGLQDLIVFRQAFKVGLTYWDTADSYGWGNNEKAIGKYFSRFPDDRQKVFLVTKAATSNPKKLSDKLNKSLQRMNTSYIDMYFIH